MMDLPNSKGRILIVDDQEEIRNVISKILAWIGYEVGVASNGREGLRLFLEDPFNLVITDLSMPEVDGLTLAFSIKERSPRTPVVLITGNASDEARGGPIDLVMHKPFNIRDLEQTARRFLRKIEQA